jgi:formylglycine-generating enzyme required for sulfatase activity
MAVDIETVYVGNVGNAGEWSGATAEPSGANVGTGPFPNRICGAVDYEYRIGKYEVTAGQYAEFLNKVARTDPYGLYNETMDVDSGLLSSEYGCNIKRGGSDGSYTYSVATDWANRPVNFVGWADAARFANWLHNGQPTGAQSAGTTESGAYDMSGTQSYYGPGGVVPFEHMSTFMDSLFAIDREADWKWAIASEDEWYKAAYYDPAASDYNDYATGSDSTPGRDMTETANPGNNANYYGNPHPLDSPHYTTVAGEFELSAGPYGTFDQGGNIWEWNEAIMSNQRRGLRGGGHDNDVQFHDGLHAWFRHSYNPTHEDHNIGIRVVRTPGPGALILMAGGLPLLLKCRRLRLSVSS